MRKGIVLLTAAILIATVVPVFAQGNLDDVKLFQNYFFDTPITKNPYGQAGLDWAKYKFGEGDYAIKYSTMQIGAQGGYGVNEKMEVNADVNFMSISPDEGDGESGLADIGIYTRRTISSKNGTDISAGGMITLPIGSEDIGQGNLNFGAFGAIRHGLKSGMVVTGSAALLFLEQGDERDNTLQLGGGVIYPKDDKMNIVGEFVLRTEGEYMMLSVGADYKMNSGRLRGALGLGLDDGAPDFMIMAKYGIVLDK